MYLLDTHIFIWLVNGSSKLSDGMKQRIFDARTLGVYVSIASFWEIAVKISVKKLDLQISINDAIKICSEDFKFYMLDIKAKHLDILKNLDFYHKDPFDRLIISQAIAENMTLISADKYTKAYPVKWLWQD